MSTVEQSSPPFPTIPVFEVGKKLAGVYVLRRELSEGIWLAHDEIIGKDVSLHFIPPELRQDERSMAELRQEIKRNRQLIHPGILRVYDLVEEPEWSAISMDWFEGESLASILKSRPGEFFEPAEVKPWLQQVCQTLDDIHKIQIVHRDIGTHNIYIDPRGRVLIAKFGISRVIEDALARLSRGDEETESRLASMSPQLLDGENPNKVDDIYSVGATIYELLTGELPFTGPDLLPQIRRSQPMPMMDRRAKLGKRGGTILPVWEKWVGAALSKSREERPQSAGELAAKLGLTGKLSSEGIGSAAGAVSKPPASSSKLAASGISDSPASAPAEKGGIAPAAAVAAIAVATVESAEKKKETEAAGGEAKPGPAAAEAASAPFSSPAEQPEMPAPPAPSPLFSSAKAGDSFALASSHHPDEDDDDFGARKTGDEPAEVYSEFQPRSSNAWPAVLIFGALIAVVGGAIYFLSRPDKSDGSRDSMAGDSTSRAVVATPAATPAENSVVASSGADSTNPNSKGEIPGAGNPDRLSGEPDLVGAGSSGSGENLLAANNPPFDRPRGTPAAETGKEPRAVDAKATPAAAATPSAPPAATSSKPGSNTAANTAPTPVASGGEADPDKAYTNAVNQKKSADAALAEADKAVQKKTKANESILKAAEPLLAQRNQRAEQLKASEEAVETARKAVEEKERAAAEAKKSLSDWEAANHEKLAARDKASSELEALQAALTEKQQLAATAAQALAAADSEREKQSAAMKLAQENAEKERQAAKQAADEAARKAAETRAQQQQQIDEEIKRMQDRLKELQKMREQPAEGGPAPGVPPAPVTPPPSAVSATPAPSTPPPAAATPRPAPPAPPGPHPLNGTQTEFLGINPPIPFVSPGASPTAATPVPGAATPVRSAMAMLSATPRIVSATPPVKATPAPEEPAAAFQSENSLGMKFVPVGDVQFCIWPVRVRDFEVFAKETGFRNSAWRNPGFKQGPDHPVVNVSWNDAVAFCKWLTAREQKNGLLAKGQEYRLPTDLEWSQAVGLPKEEGKTPDQRDMAIPNVFPWGTQWPPPPNVGNYTGVETGSDVAIQGYDDGFAWTSPVGSFPPNKYGLYDMGGNVWQWCQDSLNAESKAKVLRGSSWYNGAVKLSLLSSCRFNAFPDRSTDNYGFRVVRTEGSRSARAAR